MPLSKECKSGGWSVEANCLAAVTDSSHSLREVVVILNKGNRVALSTAITLELFCPANINRGSCWRCRQYARSRAASLRPVRFFRGQSVNEVSTRGEHCSSITSYKRTHVGRSRVESLDVVAQRGRRVIDSSVVPPSAI